MEINVMGPKLFGFFEETLPVFSELMFERLDKCSEIFTDSPLFP